MSVDHGALQHVVVSGLYFAAAVVVAVLLGLCVLGEALLKAYDRFCRQSDREYAYLVEWYTGSDSPVGEAHADRSAARYAHASEPPSAAGEGSCGEAPARPADGFYASYAHAALSAGEDES